MKQPCIKRFNDWLLGTKRAPKTWRCVGWATKKGHHETWVRSAFLKTVDKILSNMRFGLGGMWV